MARQEVTIIPSGKIARKVSLTFERWAIISDLNFWKRFDYFQKKTNMTIKEQFFLSQ
jgi:hypothetical protein